MTRPVIQHRALGLRNRENVEKAIFLTCGVLDLYPRECRMNFNLLSVPLRLLRLERSETRCLHSLKCLASFVALGRP